MVALLRGRVLGKFNALFDVTLQSLASDFDQLLLSFVGAAEDVHGFLGTGGLLIKISKIAEFYENGHTYTKFNGNREIVNADLLSNCITPRDTRKVDVCGFDDAFLTLGGFDEFLSESTHVKDSPMERIFITYRKPA